MPKLHLIIASGLFALCCNSAHAQTSFFVGNPTAGELAFDAAVAASGSSTKTDAWINPVWNYNDGTHTGTTQMPFVFDVLQRTGYTVEKGLFPMGIPSRQTYLPVQQAGVIYDPLITFSSLNGQAVNVSPDSQAAGGGDIYDGFHPGIEYGLTFRFDHAINAFGLEYQLEAHNASPEPSRPSIYFSVDNGPGQLVTGPITPDSTDTPGFVGLLSTGKSFSTITFYTDGPRDGDGALIDFYNAYAGGTIRYASLSAVPEPETMWMMVAGLGLMGWSARRKSA